MGTSGQMSTNNTYVKYTISITQNWQDVSSNATNITVTVRFFRTNSGYETWGTGTCYCKIDGTIYSASVSSSQKITSSGINLFTKTLTIYHGSDGSKYLDTSAWISLDAPLSSSEQWYGEWMATIPRASQPSLSSSSVTMGNSVTIYTNRASSSFSHILYWQISGGGWNWIASNIGTSYSWTVPLDFANKVPSSTNLSVEMILETYNGNTHIGTKNVYLTANVPSSVVPTISSVTLSENVSGIASKFGTYVQGKSQIKGTISASGSYSSTIKTYSISINGQSFSSSSFTTNALTGSGTCSVTVTDTRNRTASNSQSYTVTSYSNPSISTFTVFRCNSDGTQNDEGAYAKCTMIASISSVNSKNDKDFKLLYKKKSDSYYTTVNLSNSSYSYSDFYILPADINQEYEFIFRATDYFGSTEKSANIGTAFTLMDFNANGRSVAFGRVSTATGTESKAQIKMDVEIEGNLKINSKTIFDLIYPVGAIYMSTSSTNPGTLFGGTWTSWGSGRVPVGVNTSDTDFSSVEKTGGSKTHRHVWRIGMHWWYGAAAGEGTGNSTGAYRYSDSQYDGWARDLASKSMTVNTANYNSQSGTTGTPSGKWSLGDTDVESGLQPYITCYMFKRTA